MRQPSDDEVRTALEHHALRVQVTEEDAWWAFYAHPLNEYREADALRLTKVNLMLGTKPNGSLTSEMLVAVVERIAALELRQDQHDESAAERQERER